MTTDEVRTALIRTLRVIERQKWKTPLGRAWRAAMWADSYSRLDAVMEHYEHLPRLQWFKLLGEQWSGCDNIVRWRPGLRRILRGASREELDAMMRPHERAALAKLPNRVRVYRGCYDNNRAGLSWTLERQTAERFPSLLRYRQEGRQPLLCAGITRRARAVLKLDRNEAEIIAPSVQRLTEEPIELVSLERAFGAE